MPPKKSTKQACATLEQESSNVAPGGVGNTVPPLSHKKPQGSCKRIWLITLKMQGSSKSSLKQWIQEHCDCAVWQIEKGESGYLHYQITMTLKVKQRLSWLKNHFCKIAHCEVVENINAAFEYAQKDDSRIEGPFYWPEPVKKCKDPLEGKTYYPWQQEIIDIIKTEPDDRTIHWYWEETGKVGKSHFVKHIVLTHDNAHFVNGKKTDIYYALEDNIKILLIDIPRPMSNHIGHLYTVLEEVKNGLIFSGKFKSKTKCFDPPHIFVFANVPPDTHQLSEDKWNIRYIGKNNKPIEDSDNDDDPIERIKKQTN